jgi:hypothetical protein
MRPNTITLPVMMPISAPAIGPASTKWQARQKRVADTDRGQPHHQSDRDVYAADGQHEGHAEPDDEQLDAVAQNGREIGREQEVRRGQRKDDRRPKAAGEERQLSSAAPRPKPRPHPHPGLRS